MVMKVKHLINNIEEEEVMIVGTEKKKLIPFYK